MIPVAVFLLLPLLSLQAFAQQPAAVLQQRIDQALPGSVIEVDGGHYIGKIQITRPVVLRGLNNPRLQGERTHHVIQILAPDVTVEGFEISHSGLNLSADHAAIHIKGGDGAVIRHNVISNSLHGVYSHGSSNLRIEHNQIAGISEIEVDQAGPTAVPMGAAAAEGDLCSVVRERRGNGIHLWNSENNIITDNIITGARDGIYFSFARQSRIERNTVSGTRYGLHYMYSDQNYFAANTFHDNTAGAALMFSKEITIRNNAFTSNSGPRAYGMLMHNVDFSILRQNRLASNRIGIYMQNSHVNQMRQNEFESNYVGMRLTSSSTGNVFTRNRIGRNLHNVDLAGRNNQNRWDEEGIGNHWSGIQVLDLDQDGVSELPHREVDLLGSHREEFPFVAFLSGSPAIKALQYALQRAPVPGTHYITDYHPLDQRRGGEAR